MSHSVEPIAKRLRQRIKTVESKTAKNKKRTNQLLALNDDCLYAVFQNLNIESLCHTANVCKRMRSVAEQVFHRYFRNSCFVVDENQYQWSMSPENSNYMSGNIINKTVLRRILCKFGHLMTTFDPVIGFYDHLGIKCDDILKYSSENLNHLRLRGITISSEELAPIMPRLKFLGLNDCEIDYPEVLMHHFPKLKHLDLRYTNIRPDTLANILRLNPQLKYLEMRGLNDSEFISVITENAKDLEKLKFEFCYGWKPRDDHVNDILLFSKLKKLKVFEFIQVKYASIAKSGKLLIKSFANENIAIEELSLGGFSFDADDITNLANQKALRYLFVSKVKQMNDSDLEFLLSRLPLLKSLDVTFSTTAQATITLCGLFTMVKFGKLKEVSFSGCHNIDFQMTEDDYELLLDDFQNSAREKNQKLSIYIGHFGEKIAREIPESFENEEQLEIELAEETFYLSEDE